MDAGRQGRRVPGDGRRRAGGGRRHRPRRHGRARAHARGSGDSVQALKAGIMEIPDIIVVNKSDHPLTDTMVREIRGVLSLAPQGAGRCRSSRRRRRGGGRRGARSKMVEHRAHVEAEGTLSERRRRNLRERGPRDRDDAAAPRARGVAAVRTPTVQALLDEVVARRLDPASAASAVLWRAATVDPADALPIRPVTVATTFPALTVGSCGWAIAMFACAAMLAALPAPARAEPLNGQLAAVVDGRLVTVNADGTGLRTLWTPPDASEITGLAWSPDGNRLAFSYAGRIVVYRHRGRAGPRSPTGTATRAPAGRPTGADRVRAARAANGRPGRGRRTHRAAVLGPDRRDRARVGPER